MIELDVISYLNNDSTLYALLGATGTDSKIYPVQMPHGATEPFIIFTTNSIGSLEENISELSMSFNCIDSSYNTAKGIRDRISFLLDRQDAIQNLITSTEYYIYWCKKVGGSVFKDPDLDIFHHATIFDFKYAEMAREAIDVINKILTIPAFGTFVDEKIIFNGLYFPASITIKKVAVHADVAPTGANVTVDLLKNDVEQTRIATLTAGSRDELTDITDISYGTADKFGIVIKSIGAIEPGEGGTIEIQYQ